MGYGEREKRRDRWVYLLGKLKISTFVYLQV